MRFNFKLIQLHVDLTLKLIQLHVDLTLKLIQLHAGAMECSERCEQTYFRRSGLAA